MTTFRSVKRMVGNNRKVVVRNNDRRLMDPFGAWSDFDDIFNAFRRDMNRMLWDPSPSFGTTPRMRVIRRGYQMPMNLEDKEDSFLLTVEMPGLHKSLSATIESSWGTYVVTLRRGTAYPETTADRAALLDQAASNAEIALLRSVVDGGELFVRLEDEDDTVLQAAPVRLRGLLSDADAHVETRLRGRIDAHHVRIALDAGSSKPRKTRKE